MTGAGELGRETLRVASVMRSSVTGFLKVIIELRQYFRNFSIFRFKVFWRLPEVIETLWKTDVKRCGWQVLRGRTVED